MFKGLTGLKKAVTGGFHAVAEHSSQLAEQVVSDPSTSRDQLKQSLKQKVQGGVATVVDAGENVLANESTNTTKDKVKETAHRLKHHCHLGEEILGYSDPANDLRKAVKAKEKKAKKARKEKKKKTGKKGEDLFDPENLAKYKKELEEKRRLAQETEAGDASSSPEDAPEESGAAAGAAAGAGAAAEAADDSVDFTLRSSTQEGAESATPGRTPAGSGVNSPFRSEQQTPKEDKEDWKLFQNLTSGVDHLIKKTQDELETIKKESFFQRKPVVKSSDDPNEDDKSKKKKKKRWVNLDLDSFEDREGTVSGEEEDDSKDSQDDAEESGPEEKQDDSQTESKKPAEVAEEEEEDKNKPLVFKEPSFEEPVDDDDLFNTEFVTKITSGDVKLAVIPDSPTYDEEDDPFNTAFADKIVKQQELEKKREASKLKFTGLSNVADVLSGKVDKLDKSSIEHTVKRKRRRANRINLIGDEASEVTAIDDIASVKGDSDQDASVDILTEVADALPVPEGDLLATTPSPCAVSGENKQEDKARESKGGLDLSEFETFTGGEEAAQLTSNVAILSGEFSKPAEEEEDDFDAAFDALAQESVTKSKLEDLEKQFENDDIFDTSCADKVLNLASLIDKVEEEPLPQEIFDDPFDTTAYEHIAGEVETELEFESLAHREPGNEKDNLEVALINAATSSSPFDAPAAAPQVDEGWAAFGEEKKKPPRPAPPRPDSLPKKRPPPPKVTLDPADRPETPSVVVKAPSSDSIKSWNVSVAENLIKKSAAEAAEALVEQEEEFDPFDTQQFDIDQKKEEEDEYEEVVDPFDTTAVDDIVAVKKEEEEPSQNKESVDLLGEGPEDSVSEAPIIPVSRDVTAPEVDPFDTSFAADILPNKGDPFDTSYVTGVPGKAEIKALEEEFLEPDEFDPRTAEGTAIPKRKGVPGVAGRSRPKAGHTTDLSVKIPTETNSEERADKEEEDPFDTSIVDKVIPLRKARKRPELSVEDDDFDPSLTFRKSQEIKQSISINEEEEVDPFDTTIANVVLPEDEQTKSVPVEKQFAAQKSESISDDDFDPRA